MRYFRVFAAIALAYAPPVAAQPATGTVPAFVAPEGEAECRPDSGYAADLDGARTFLWRPRWLAALVADDGLRAEIIRNGEVSLANGPYSVTDKPQPVAGASIHSYASIGPYWWPNPDTDDGLPYVRRDGEVNPERSGPEFDKDRLRNLGSDMRALALAYHVTRDERFAAHAAMLLRVWFIDPATRMEPHFNFAQGIPGQVTGRGEGIIEASDLSTIVEAVGLLKPSAALTDEEERVLRQWYGDFAVWMATSDIGAEEMAKTNNHGMFYDFYLAHFALFAGAPGVVTNLARNFPEYRLAVQMDRQGRFLQELERTRSWHYSHYVVDAAARLATIAECAGLDLWRAQLPDGRSMATAQDFLARYQASPRHWPFPDRDLASGRVARMEATRDALLVLVRRTHLPGELAQLP